MAKGLASCLRRKVGLCICATGKKWQMSVWWTKRFNLALNLNIWLVVEKPFYMSSSSSLTVRAAVKLYSTIYKVATHLNPERTLIVFSPTVWLCSRTLSVWIFVSKSFPLISLLAHFWKSFSRLHWCCLLVVSVLSLLCQQWLWDRVLPSCLY